MAFTKAKLKTMILDDKFDELYESEKIVISVSYTHLTLPTIYSV